VKTPFKEGDRVRLATANVTGTVLRVICAYVNTSTGQREERFKIRVQWPNGVVMVADAAYLEVAPE
jgi:hypothetical protein